MTMRRVHIAAFCISMPLTASCLRKPAPASNVKFDVMADTYGLGSLGLSLKTHQPGITLCLAIERPDTAVNDAHEQQKQQPPVAESTTATAQNGAVLDSGASLTDDSDQSALGAANAPVTNNSTTAPPAAEAPLSDEFIKKSLVEAGMAWLNALREQVAEVEIASAVVLKPVTDVGQCDSSNDGMITLSPSVSRAHVMPSGFPRMHLGLDGSGFGAYEGFNREQTFQYAALHEFGHMFGLGDLYVEGVARCKPGQPIESVMCGSVKHFLQLQTDDRQGIKAAHDRVFAGKTANIEVTSDRTDLADLLKQEAQLSSAVRDAEAHKKAVIGDLSKNFQGKWKNLESKTPGKPLQDSSPPADESQKIYEDLFNKQQELSQQLTDLDQNDKARFDTLYATFKENANRIRELEAKSQTSWNDNFAAACEAKEAGSSAPFTAALDAVAKQNKALDEVTTKIWDWDSLSAKNKQAPPNGN